MSQFRLAIAGSGMIAGVIANAAKQIANVELAAVASRRPESAAAFAEEHGVTEVFDTWQEMLASDRVDGVYIATPTVAKEEIALFAAEHGKHLLVDKPFTSLASVQRMTEAARAHGVAYMDATHFSNNPRTGQIRADMPERIGTPQAVRSSFFFPFMDKDNIRFNPEKEPTGAVGDMAWYSLRAVVEYLDPRAPIRTLAGSIVRDEDTGAVVRGTGMVAFEDGKSSTFDFGYNAGVCLMDLDILGTEGAIQLSDFVLDWKSGFAFDNQGHVNGYTLRSGMAQPSEFEFVAADAEEPQAVSMVRNFAALAQAPTSDEAESAMRKSLKTQELLDAYWMNVK